MKENILDIIYQYYPKNIPHSDFEKYQYTQEYINLSQAYENFTNSKEVADFRRQALDIFAGKKYALSSCSQGVFPKKRLVPNLGACLGVTILADAQSREFPMKEVYFYISALAPFYSYYVCFRNRLGQKDCWDENDRIKDLKVIVETYNNYLIKYGNDYFKPVTWWGEPTKETEEIINQLIKLQNDIFGYKELPKELIHERVPEVSVFRPNYNSQSNPHHSYTDTATFFDCLFTSNLKVTQEEFSFNHLLY